MTRVGRRQALYRRRGDAFEHFTVDHSEVNESGSSRCSLRRRTSLPALGGHDEIGLETVLVRRATGDRFILCSDGLYRG